MRAPSTSASSSTACPATNRAPRRGAAAASGPAPAGPRRRTQPPRSGGIEGVVPQVEAVPAARRGGDAPSGSSRRRRNTWVWRAARWSAGSPSGHSRPARSPSGPSPRCEGEGAHSRRCSAPPGVQSCSPSSSRTGPSTLPANRSHLRPEDTRSGPAARERPGARSPHGPNRGYRPRDPEAPGRPAHRVGPPRPRGYLAGGLMPAAAAAGARATCVIATCGERGGPPDLQAQTAWRREEELHDARPCGVDDLVVLGRPDGGWPARLKRARRHARPAGAPPRPDTVVTFGPDGHTGHPDHRAASAWAGAAIAGRIPARPRLLHTAVTAAMAAAGADIDVGSRSSARAAGGPPPARPGRPSAAGREAADAKARRRGPRRQPQPCSGGRAHPRPLPGRVATEAFADAASAEAAADDAGQPTGSISTWVKRQPAGVRASPKRYTSPSPARGAVRGPWRRRAGRPPR